MSPAAVPPVPRVTTKLPLADRDLELATRALIVAVVPPPRFGRDAEVVSGVRSAAAARADLVEVPDEPGLIGPAVRANGPPVAVRVGSIDRADAARSAGAALVLVPADLTGLTELAHRAEGEGWPAAVLVRSAGAVAAARDHSLPVALDATLWSGADAVAQEALALAAGCRILRTVDVRRSRRVVEVMAAILEARRPSVGPRSDA